MAGAIQLDSGVLGIGRSALHMLRSTLGASGAGSLQQAGFAAGDQLYGAFQKWLEQRAGIKDPADLDANTLSEVLGQFFQSLGWGAVTLTKLGEAGLAIDAPDWAEAEPGANASATSCHVSSGLLSAFLSQIASQNVAVMEVECRTCGDPRCRFLAGAPETLEMVYEAMADGKSYEAALKG